MQFFNQQVHTHTHTRVWNEGVGDVPLPSHPVTSTVTSGQWDAVHLITAGVLLEAEGKLERRQGQGHFNCRPQMSCIFIKKKKKDSNREKERERGISNPLHLSEQNLAVI